MEMPARLARLPAALRHSSADQVRTKGTPATSATTPSATASVKTPRTGRRATRLRRGSRTSATAATAAICASSLPRAAAARQRCVARHRCAAPKPVSRAPLTPSRGSAPGCAANLASAPIRSASRQSARRRHRRLRRRRHRPRRHPRRQRRRRRHHALRNRRRIFAKNAAITAPAPPATIWRVGCAAAWAVISRSSAHLVAAAAASAMTAAGLLRLRRRRRPRRHHRHLCHARTNQPKTFVTRVAAAITSSAYLAGAAAPPNIRTTVC